MSIDRETMLKDKELVELNMKVAIAFGVLMIVGLLIYIAFYK